MDFILQNAHFILIVAVLAGFFMAWGIGANDVANAMGTSVGSRALTVKQAILIAVVFEAAGAYLAGGEVTGTIRKGIIDAEAFSAHPEYLVYTMMASLLAAGCWLFIASMRGWPVSTTHSIVGAIVGAAAVALGVDAVKWDKIGTIALSWITSPLLAAVISFLLIFSVNKLIFNAESPLDKAKRYVPVYMFLTGFVMALVTFTKGLKHVGLELSLTGSLAASVAIGMSVATLGAAFLLRVAGKKPTSELSAEKQSKKVERMFAVLMIFTACAMAFAHGSNDVANAIGPLAAIYSVITNEGLVSAKAVLPQWILLVGAAGIVAGLVTLGSKVMGTIGRKITELTPSKGFAAELGAATTVVLASGIGLPISTTHTLVGAVLGVGIAQGVGAVNFRVMGTIFASWAVTLPAGALLSIVFFYILKAVFS